MAMQPRAVRVTCVTPKSDFIHSLHKHRGIKGPREGKIPQGVHLDGRNGDRQRREFEKLLDRSAY